MMEEIADGAETVDQLFPRGADAREHVGRHGQPGARRLHLLLRQLHLPRSHVLERPHVDLLEADDLFGNQHLALLGHIRRVAALGEPAQDPHALGADGVGEVVDSDALDVRDLLLVLAEVQLLDLVGHALHQVDRFRIDGGEGAAPVDLCDDLPALGLLLVTRCRVDDEEVVGRDGAQRDVVGRIRL